MSRILVVEDEGHIAQGLRFNLEAEGHTVELTDLGEDALTRLLQKREQYDLLVLDVMLPGKDGFTVAAELRRARQYIPLLMLTARGRPEDVLKGFESGADDYLPKPFNLDILIARVASLLRRKKWQQTPAAGAASGPPPDASAESETLTFDGKTFDFQHMQLRTSGQVYQLTLMESELLRYLVSNSGRPVTRKEILEKVWDLHEDTDTRAIDNFIVRLRRYIEDDSSRPRHLLTIRGLGYQFVLEPKA
jgi:DNA-binding response OmpR family regulator